MMIVVNRIGDNITGFANGKPFGVSYSDERYAAMKQLEEKAAAATKMDEMKLILAEFEPLTKEDYKQLVEHAQGGQYLYVNPHNGKVFLKIKDMISDIALPQPLVNRIITSVEKKIDVLPLVKCWARFLRDVPGRPSYTPERGDLFAKYIDADYTNQAFVNELVEKHGLSKEVATARATTKQVSITQEGLLVCYKVSREVLHRYELNENEEVVTKSRYKKTVDPDTGVITMEETEHVEDRLFEPYVMGQSGDEFWCVGNGVNKKGHHIRVGCTHYLEDWSQVSSPGHKGLHCGGLRYIHGYQQGENAITHNIFVDPMDIHTILDAFGYGSDGAMTVKRYFVHSSFAGVNRSIYHSSEYAKITDSEYEKLIEAAVTQSQQRIDAIDNEIKQAKALL